MWGDEGTYGEISGDVPRGRRCGEMWGDVGRVRARGARQWMESLGACREMWGDAHAHHVVGRYGEIWGGLSEVVESLGAGRAQGGSGA